MGFLLCLHSSQRPQAQEFTFHSLGFSNHGGEAKQLKRRLGFLRACLFSFFFFSVNSIHIGKGNKNTIVARRKSREEEGESTDLYTHIVMDETDSRLFVRCFQKTRQWLWDAGLLSEMYQLDKTRSALLLSQLSLPLLKCSVSRRRRRLQSAGLGAKSFDCGQQGVREN